MTIGTLPGETLLSLPPVPEHDHGSSGWWHSRYKCPHPLCLDAYREQKRVGARNRRARRRAARYLDPATNRWTSKLLAPVDSLQAARHGTRNGFIEFSCCCRPCSQAAGLKASAAPTLLSVGGPWRIHHIAFIAAMCAAIAWCGLDTLAARSPRVERAVELAAALLAFAVSAVLHHAGQHALGRYGAQISMASLAGGWANSPRTQEV